MRRRWWILALAIIAVAGVATIHSLSQRKAYTATAALLFRDPQLDQKFFGASFFAPNTDAQREAATNVQLVSLQAISRIAATTLKAEGVPVTPADVQGSVTVESAGQSNVVKINATRPNPREAARVANVFATTYITFRRDNDRAKVTEAQQTITQQIARLPSGSAQTKQLLAQDEQLNVLKALQTGNAELVETATQPPSPSAPRPKRSAAIGIILGGLLGTFLMMLAERLDRRIRDVDELQEILQLPILAGVGLNTSLSPTSGPAKPDRMSALEPFRMLRANLAFFALARERKTVVVTSAIPGDGKTTVAVSLATVAATAGQRVLLVEADLRRPTLARQLGLTGGSGLSAVLSGQATFEDAVVQHELPAVGNSDGHAALDVLMAGAPPPNPAELVGSDTMTRLLETWESDYDLVVIDTPPVTVVSDALLLLHGERGVVLVVRLNATTREAATRMRQQFATIGVVPLGIVVNNVKTRGRGYYYADYGYSSSSQPSPTADDQQASVA